MGVTTIFVRAGVVTDGSNVSVQAGTKATEHILVMLLLTVLYIKSLNTIGFDGQNIFLIFFK
jgi:hypothetical protein